VGLGEALEHVIDNLIWIIDYPLHNAAPCIVMSAGAETPAVAADGGPIRPPSGLEGVGTHEYFDGAALGLLGYVDGVLEIRQGERLAGDSAGSNQAALQKVDGRP
jgi:hypothetical protein